MEHKAQQVATALTHLEAQLTPEQREELALLLDEDLAPALIHDHEPALDARPVLPCQLVKEEALVHLALDGSFQLGQS